MRTIGKHGWCEQMAGGHPPQPREKVDVVASPEVVQGEKCLQASLNNRMTWFSKMASWRGLPNIGIKCCLVTSSEPSDAESTSSSVGSCSTSSSAYRSPDYPGMVLTQYLSSHSDNAEISCGSGREPSLPTEEVLPMKTHQLELHAYRSTMMALYASGPISWEQEALMTNLRLMLNISNDEHLLELKNLVSSKIGTSPLS
ncbi:hypothetical protein COCNU_02G000640 [Cocos nucifera]|uniref:ENT domain-containing protein n=1 Tax=Cocos nucifera TaxID=13894 RepID=A0A8K0MVY2_COCNU|nr:hypothetical protein COCNU_02G000640 [Cocos nucifera]